MLIMKLYNKILLICGLTIVLTACYEKPPAPIDGLIKESLGTVPAAVDFTWIGDEPLPGGQVSFTFNFWSNTDISAINMYEIVDVDTTLLQTNTFAESGYSQFYNTDTIAYTFNIPNSLISGDDLDYMGEVVNTNGNTATRSIDFDVQ